MGVTPTRISNNLFKKLRNEFVTGFSLENFNSHKYLRSTGVTGFLLFRFFFLKGQNGAKIPIKSFPCTFINTQKCSCKTERKISNEF